MPSPGTPPAGMPAACRRTNHHHGDGSHRGNIAAAQKHAQRDSEQSLQYVSRPPACRRGSSQVLCNLRLKMPACIGAKHRCGLPCAGPDPRPRLDNGADCRWLTGWRSRLVWKSQGQNPAIRSCRIGPHLAYGSRASRRHRFLAPLLHWGRPRHASGRKADRLPTDPRFGGVRTLATGTPCGACLLRTPIRDMRPRLGQSFETVQA